MSSPAPIRHVLSAALLALFLTGVATETFAQSEAMESLRKRHGDKEKKKQEPKQEEAAAELYPEATREQPKERASRQISPMLEAMMESYRAERQSETRSVADQILAEPEANAYERALANQVAAQAAYKMEDTEAAKTYLRNAIEANGLDNNGHYQSMYMLSQLQMQDEQYAEALATIDRFLTETKAKDPQYLVLKGNALYRLERLPEAIAALEQGVEAAGDKVEPEWLQLLMGAYYDSDQPAEAARVAEEALALKPDDKKMLLNLATIYMQADQADKATALLEKMRAGGHLTEDRDYRNLFVLYLNSEGGEQQAIDVIKEGIDKGILEPDYQTWLALGQAYYFTDQIAPAIENYRKAAPLAPDGETYLNLARLLWGEGELGEAKQAAQKALDKGLKNPQDAEKILAQKG